MILPRDGGQVGKTISHYKILEKLGEGGMGVVYKAEDTKLKRTVALKFLPSHLLTNEEEKTRFLHEAQSASALSHSNITTIYEIDEVEGQTPTDRGRLFIAMECVEGETLKDKLEKGSLKTKELLNIAISVSDGLNAAHEHDIVHRDIKSENIMISKTAPVKIMDFGLAKRKGMTKITKTGSTLGTLAYMSPEQAEGLEVDRRSDLFSFGVVMYEMATGQLPFKGEHDAAVLYSIVNEAPLPVRTLNPNIPKELERFIHKALEKEVEDRYQHADDLGADLKKLKKGLETERTVIAGAPIPPHEKEERKPTWRIPAYIFGVIVIGAIAILLYSSIVKDSKEITEPGINPKSVAVLPFSTLKKTEEDIGFSEGITDVIITQLFKIKDLNVISRTSSFQYKDKEMSLREIGNELGVASILEGSIQRSGNRIRIVSQLIDTKTDEHLWAETYDRDYSDIFAIQSDVAQQIAMALKATLTQKEKGYIEKKPTDSIEAYEYYLTGLYYWNKRSGDNVIQAKGFFEKAIEIDPLYARAYVGLADCYNLLTEYALVRPGETYPKARAAALKALEIDPEIAEAHTSLAYTLTQYYWDWDEAEHQYQQAIKLNPNYATGHQWYGEYLVYAGRYEEAARELEIALTLDPLSPVIYHVRGWIFQNAGEIEQAIKYYNKVLEIDSTFGVTMENLRLLYSVHNMENEFVDLIIALLLKEGTSKENVEVLRRHYLQAGINKFYLTLLEMSLEEAKNGAISPWPLVDLYRSIGDTTQALEWLDKALVYEVAQDRYYSHFSFAVQYALLNKMDKAYKWLDDAIKEKDYRMIYVRQDYFQQLFGTDKRYDEILSKMGL